MIVPDLNLLIYAHNDEASQHVAARRWWEGLLSGQERVGLPWVVITGFVRLMTHPQSVARTISPDAAMDYVQHWLEFPHVAPLNPGSEHLVHFRHCLATVGVGGNLVTDCHIAAIAMEHQAEVHSNDGDFARFPGLLWRKDYEKIGEGHYRKMVKRNWHPAHRHLESQGMDGTTIGQS